MASALCSESEAASEKFHRSRDADGETVSLTDNLSLISLCGSIFLDI